MRKAKRKLLARYWAGCSMYFDGRSHCMSSMSSMRKGYHYFQTKKGHGL